MATLRKEKASFFLKAGRGFYNMTVGDAILSLVDKLLTEREKVIRLELLQNFQQSQDEQSSKDYL